MRRILACLFPLLLALSARGQQPLDLSRLKLPEGFHITVFAGVDSPRMMVFSPGGVLLVSDFDDGKVVALPDPTHAGKSERSVVVLNGLNGPHGLAFYEGRLYVAENDRVRRYDWDEASLRASNPQHIADLPGRGGHATRTLLFHQGKMYVSVGSSCNACVERDSRRAAVLEFNPDGSGQKIFAGGLRNAVGIAVNPKTDTIWVTVNSRDWLGDDLPPDVVVDLRKAGGNGGWPFCYGDRVSDPNFARPGDDRCKSMIPPKVQIQAHSAPLGLAFYEGTMFPSEYRNNVFVALHGSWNRSVPTGYKVVRVKLDDQGQPIGGAEDFITGWLAPGDPKRGRRMGRPAGIVFGSDGSMYLSDDAGGLIYRVTWAH